MSRLLSEALVQSPPAASSVESKEPAKLKELLKDKCEVRGVGGWGVLDLIVSLAASIFSDHKLIEFSFRKKKCWKKKSNKIKSEIVYPMHKETGETWRGSSSVRWEYACDKEKRDWKRRSQSVYRTWEALGRRMRIKYFRSAWDKSRGGWHCSAIQAAAVWRLHCTDRWTIDFVPPNLTPCPLSPNLFLFYFFLFSLINKRAVI